MNYFSFYKDGKALYCLIFTAVLFTFSSSFAVNSSRHFSFVLQQNQIKGTVTDGSVPLPGVTIGVKGSGNNYSITDYSGQYIINAASNDTLIVSFMGFKTKYVPINRNTKLDITLQYDTTTLQEVRVNAGYYSVKESDRTGSIARITSKDIENQPVTNVLATMQGRMAGVNIVQTTGVPGGGFEIKIRGQNSFRAGANNPLYVIDGVPYTADPIGSGTGSAVLPTQPSPLNSINPEQIESIEVLKDADATSIYGSRGANGVVLITTKKGRTGKTSFNVKVATGASTVTRFMDLMNTEQYISMRKQAYANDGVALIPSTAYDIDGTWDQSRYTDWQKELLGGTAEVMDLQASITGGSEQTQFMVSSNYNYQGSVYIGDFRYKKGGFRTNVNHESENRKFKINASVGYTMQNNNQPQVDLMRETYSIAPNAPALYNADGTLNWENNTFNNPLRNLTGKYIALTNDLIANSFISYSLTSNLQLQTNIGYTSLTNSENTENPSTRFNPSFGYGPENSTLTTGRMDRISWIIEPQVSWSEKIALHSFNFIAGATFQSQKSNQQVQYGSGFANNGLISNIASASSVTTLLSSETLYKYQAMFGRLNYSFDDKYIVNLTGRRDGSSRFGPGRQFAGFGAVGIAWLFAREKIFKDSHFLSFGKLRASYGTTGSDQIGDYQFLDTYTIAGIKYSNISGLQPSRLFNPNFGWEINKKFETALEIGFFKDRLFLTAAYYDNRSSNQLAGIPLPGTTGFTSVQSNLDALVQNNGLEFTLRSLNAGGKNLNWSTNFNITFSHTKLLEFPNLAGSTYANTLVIGEPLNIKKVYHYVGINQQSGTYDFKDVNEDGMLTAVEDKKTISDLTPDFFGGVQNTLKYKRWQLDFLFQFAKQKNYNGSSYFVMPGTEGNQMAEAKNSWQKTGDNAAYQIYTSGTNSSASAAYFRYFESDGAISDASYVRLKNISISYDIPLQNLKCRIFLEGQNLLTFTKYNGADPEFTSLGYLPPLKVFSAGLQFNF
ncbi:SusC/RagA family TonB-linked outer membrane protein [Flavobacterium sp. DG2-3]|uniref:SusC/RagA family TonB-linked outer membrane protein n=1 Tax=Flavobacterium sp. DG2-3 TaxID=3068317 RepID=UPI00273EF7C7|nr:SusC/RagA family TonB-linked outer membrane protein [Flavobacterium sp. DG2-3]MDP5200208.1 SusC/RagA family TonB-linked outer membrane protein [Flavobacterium sp. DG2-3]